MWRNKLPISIRWGDLVRVAFYETLPLTCLAFVWTLAWADSFQARIHRELEPRTAQRVMTTISIDGQKFNLKLASAADPD